MAWTVARSGQHGFHHRTEINKKVYKIGKKGQADGETSHSASTEFDVTEKGINPMGGFPHYGVVTEDFIILKVRPRQPSKPLSLFLFCCRLLRSESPQQKQRLGMVKSEAEAQIG